MAHKETDQRCVALMDKMPSSMDTGTLVYKIVRFSSRLLQIKQEAEEFFCITSKRNEETLGIPQSSVRWVKLYPDTADRR
jgi:hypothetical protein